MWQGFTYSFCLIFFSFSLVSCAQRVMTVEQRGFLYKISSNFGIETKMWKVKIEKCSPSPLVLPLKEDFFAFGHWFCSRYCLAHRRNQQGAGHGIWKPWLLPTPSSIRHFTALFFPLLSYSWTSMVILLHLAQTEDTSIFSLKWDLFSLLTAKGRKS